MRASTVPGRSSKRSHTAVAVRGWRPIWNGLRRLEGRKSLKAGPIEWPETGSDHRLRPFHAGRFRCVLSFLRPGAEIVRQDARLGHTTLTTGDKFCVGDCFPIPVSLLVQCRHRFNIFCRGARCDLANTLILVQTLSLAISPPSTRVTKLA